MAVTMTPMRSNQRCACLLGLLLTVISHVTSFLVVDRMAHRHHNDIMALYLSSTGNVNLGRCFGVVGRKRCHSHSWATVRRFPYILSFCIALFPVSKSVSWTDLIFYLFYSHSYRTTRFVIRCRGHCSTILRQFCRSGGCGRTLSCRF
jgi:hypothetical protein